MKLLSRFFLFLGGTSCLIFFVSCCGCTDMACSPLAPSLTLFVDLGLGGEFELEELRGLTVYNTGADYVVLDSQQVGFFQLSAQAPLFELHLVPEDFPSWTPGKELKDFSYILRNPHIAQLDTFSMISYEVVKREAVCNECTGSPFCQDDLFMQQVTVQESMAVNGNRVFELRIPYSKK